MGDFLQAFDADLLSATLRLSTPILFVALGALISERSGILNISVEGIMLIGCFAGAFGAVQVSGPWFGVLGAIVCGALAGVLLAGVAVTLKASQVVLGITLNVVFLGLTSFLFVVLFDPQQGSTEIPALTQVGIPLLDRLPGVGGVLFTQQPLTFVSILLVFALHWFLFRTPPGLTLRATGESARTVDSAGVNVSVVRYTAAISGSILAAVGGAHLVLAEVHTFQPGMTAGRGFIGLAAVVFGKWKPMGAWIAALLFGTAEALSFRLQGLGWLSPSLLGTLPYVLTILALAGVVGKATPPAEDGVPYVKG